MTENQPGPLHSVCRETEPGLRDKTFLHFKLKGAELSGTGLSVCGLPGKGMQTISKQVHSNVSQLA